MQYNYYVDADSKWTVLLNSRNEILEAGVIVLIKSTFKEDFSEEAKEDRKLLFQKEKGVAVSGAVAATIILCWYFWLPVWFGVWNQNQPSGT